MEQAAIQEKEMLKKQTKNRDVIVYKGAISQPHGQTGTDKSRLEQTRLPRLES